MLTTSARPFLAGAAVAALALTSVAWAPAAAAQTAPAAATPAQVAAAAGWLAGELSQQGTVTGSFPDGAGGTIAFTDWGRTLDSALALLAAGGQDGALSRTLSRVESTSTVQEYTQGAPFDTAGSAYVGATAKLATVVELTGGDATDVAGTDLLAQLASLAQEDGTFTDRSSFGDFANLFGHSFALLAFDAAEATAPAGTVGALLGAACADGGFPQDYPAAGQECSSSIDATGLVLQALAAVDEGDSAVAQAAAGWLLEQQQADGSFAGEAPVNSTGYALLGLGALGTSSPEGVAWLVSTQQEDGGLSRGTADATTSDLFATAQALPALAGTTFTASARDVVRSVLRRAGADRYATAADISREAFPEPGVPVAYVVTGTEFADGLAGGPAASVEGGPVLPVAKAGLPAPVRAELTRLAPASIVVLGGPSAVSDAIVAELATYTAGDVTRVGGTDRYDTAAQVATRTFTAPVPQVLIATGQGFADALAGGAVGAFTASPVLLVEQGRIPAGTAAALSALEPADIAVLGGTAVISDAVLEQLRAYTEGGVNRLAGADRYETAVRTSRAFWPGTSERVYLATGGNFADALAGVPAAGADSAPLLLTRSDCLPQVVADELARLAPSQVVVLGGETAVSPASAFREVCGT